MNSSTKRIIAVVAVLQVMVAGGLLLLPKAVLALQPLYVNSVTLSHYAQPLVELVTTPLPEKIAAPSGALAQGPVTLPALTFADDPAPTATASPMPTPAPTREAGESQVPAPAAPTAIPTSTPTNTPEPTPTPSPSPTPLPPQALIEGVVNRPQTYNNCGPANLSMVLNFWGDPTTQAVAASFLKPNPLDRNVSPWQMADYVNEQTSLKAQALSGGDMDMVKRFLASGLPVVIEEGYTPDPAQGWLGHYLTIFGYDDTLGEFRSRDTYLGPFNDEGRHVSYETVQHNWQQFNYTFIIIYRPDQEALVNQILGPALTDPMKMWQQAALRAQAEVQADEQNAFAWFNLGTSLTRLGEMTGEGEYYQQGASAFDQALVLGIPSRMAWYQFRQYIAYMKVGRYQDMVELADSTLKDDGGRNVEETYLYKGHALAFLGDVNGAVAAYERALELNKYFYPAQWALDSLR